MSAKVVVENSLVRIRPVCLVALAAVLWTLAAVAGPAEDLLDAAKRGDAAAVRALLAKGADVNAKASNGGTALMWASQNGHLEVAQALLAKGADVNAVADNGMTALKLALASKEGHPEVVQLLKSAGAQ